MKAAYLHFNWKYFALMVETESLSLTLLLDREGRRDHEVHNLQVYSFSTETILYTGKWDKKGHFVE